MANTRTTKIPFSKDFLKHPKRSATMRQFDGQWEQAHKILPQLCYRVSDVKPVDVLKAYDGIHEFIEAMTNWRMRHSPRSFLKPLAYSHFLAGVLAVSWLQAADARSLGYFPVEMRDRLADMVQSALDHFTMANDLEAQFECWSSEKPRTRYGRIVTTCALAEITAIALRMKAYLPIGAAPFTQEDMVSKHEAYRSQALERTAHLGVDGKDWLRICAVGLEQNNIPLTRQKTHLSKETKSLNVIGRDIRFHMLGSSHLRMFYLWKRMHGAYREVEEYEYQKAAMNQPNGHYPEIMPLPPSDTWVTNTLINGERLYIEQQQKLWRPFRRSETSEFWGHNGQTSGRGHDI